MSKAWLLPAHIADVLPAQARALERLRRKWLDMASARGFELIIPPLLEHLESLLSGTGQALDLQTFKLVDQLSGRLMGIRADTTPQAARIDAHLLNRQGVARLCYCGPVLRSLPSGLQSSREPLQFGAEIFGHAGLEADWEIQDLAVSCLGDVPYPLSIDLADVRILSSLLEACSLEPVVLQDLVEALSAKDKAAVVQSSQGLPKSVRDALCVLTELYGGDEVLTEAARCLGTGAQMSLALGDLAWLAAHLRQVHPRLRVGFDLSDLGGFSYYSGPRFGIFCEASSDALVRGGRYDEVGAVFGRNRPAVGFSLDLKAVAALLPWTESKGAVRATWSEDRSMHQAIDALRQSGETVVVFLPGETGSSAEIAFDRELVLAGERWAVRAL